MKLKGWLWMRMKAFDFGFDKRCEISKHRIEDGS
jgi:hypothetical protein